MVSNRLAGEIAIVTGSGARGTGTAIARIFAAEGAQVVVTGRDATRGEDIAEEIRGKGGDATFIPADLGVRDDAEALVRGTVERYGGLSVLVNNATGGSGSDAGITDIDDDAWAASLQVNLTGFMYICRAAIRQMLESGYGSIVNITSRTAIRGCPGISAYSATKGAQEALTRAMAMDYSARGIRVNSVAPGYIMEKEKTAGNEHFAERSKRFEAMHLTRMPTVDDIAYAAVYLASRESGAVTGTCIPVDGGGSQVRGATLG